MKANYIGVLTGSLLLFLSTTALASENAIFVRGNMEVTPSWFEISNEVTDPATGLSFKAEMLNPNEVRWTIENLSPSGSNCQPAHLLGYRGQGVNDVSISVPFPPRDGTCTAYLELDNTKVSIVEAGRISMWSTYSDSSGTETLDIRQIEINELATMSILNETGINNAIVDQSSYVDASQVQLTSIFSNTVGMRLDVVSGNAGEVRYSKEFFNSSGGNSVTGRLPNAAFCNVSGTGLLNTTLRVYRIDIFPGQGQTPSLVSTYSGQCQNQ